MSRQLTAKRVGVGLSSISQAHRLQWTKSDGRRRSTVDQHFHEDAVGMVLEIGRPVAMVARDTRINQSYSGTVSMLREPSMIMA